MFSVQQKGFIQKKKAFIQLQEQAQSSFCTLVLYKVKKFFEEPTMWSVVIDVIILVWVILHHVELSCMDILEVSTEVVGIKVNPQRVPVVNGTHGIPHDPDILQLGFVRVPLGSVCRPGVLAESCRFFIKTPGSVITPFLAFLHLSFRDIKIVHEAGPLHAQLNTKRRLWAHRRNLQPSKVCKGWKQRH